VQASPSPDGGPLNIARRILHREDSAKIARTEPVQSAASPRLSVARKLERFLSQSLRTSTETSPIDAEEISASQPSGVAKQSQGSIAEPKTTEASDNPEEPSEFMAVGSIQLATGDAIDRQQAVYQFKGQAENLERHQAALSSAAESMAASLQQLQQSIAKEFAVELDRACQALLTQLSRQLEEHGGSAVAALNEKLGTEEQRFAGETQQGFEELRATRQAFLDDAQKQFAARTRAPLDDLIKAAVEKTRAELDAGQQNVTAESRKQSASVSGPSIEPVRKDPIGQVRADVTTSQHALIQDAQNQLTKMARLSLQRLQTLGRICVEQVDADLMVSRKAFIEETQKQLAEMTQVLLESQVKSSVEHGRRELSRMVNEFLASGIPRIEAELRILLNRYSVYTQAARRRITDGF
jgi:hypothetical protein